MAKDMVNFTGYSVQKILLEKAEPKQETEDEGKADISSTVSQNSDNKRLYRLSLLTKTTTKRKSIEVEIEGYFEIDDDVDNDVVEYFLRVTAPSILYPYSRAIISNITSFDSTEAVILPVVNFAIQNAKD